jgi:hypothetical protein
MSNKTRLAAAVRSSAAAALIGPAPGSRAVNGEVA